MGWSDHHLPSFCWTHCLSLLMETFRGHILLQRSWNHFLVQYPEFVADLSPTRLSYSVGSVSEELAIFFFSSCLQLSPLVMTSVKRKKLAIKLQKISDLLIQRLNTMLIKFCLDYWEDMIPTCLWNINWVNIYSKDDLHLLSCRQLCSTPREELLVLLGLHNISLLNLTGLRSHFLQRNDQRKKAMLCLPQKACLLEKISEYQHFEYRIESICKIMSVICLLEQ